MKDDLISRQELLNLIDHYIKHEGDARKKHSDLFVKGMEDGYFRIRSHVLQMPPAQPEIIHCKECRYCIVSDECEHWCNGFGWPARLITLDDFCSRGMRKDDGRPY